LDGDGIYKNSEKADRFNLHLDGTDFSHETDAIGFYTGTDELVFGLNSNSTSGTVLRINQNGLVLKLENGKLEASCDTEIGQFDLEVVDFETHIISIQITEDQKISVEITRLGF